MLALVAMPESFVFKAVVKFFSDRPPSPTEYVVLVSVELIVKFGYVPDTLTFEPAVRATVWSGLELVIVVPLTVIPVPPL